MRLNNQRSSEFFYGEQGSPSPGLFKLPAQVAPAGPLTPPPTMGPQSSFVAGAAGADWGGACAKPPVNPGGPIGNM